MSDFVFLNYLPATSSFMKHNVGAQDPKIICNVCSSLMFRGHNVKGNKTRGYNFRGSYKLRSYILQDFFYQKLFEDYVFFGCNFRGDAIK